MLPGSPCWPQCRWSNSLALWRDHLPQPPQAAVSDKDQRKSDPPPPFCFSLVDPPGSLYSSNPPGASWSTLRNRLISSGSSCGTTPQTFTIDWPTTQGLSNGEAWKRPFNKCFRSRWGNKESLHLSQKWSTEGWPGMLGGITAKAHCPPPPPPPPPLLSCAVFHSCCSTIEMLHSSSTSQHGELLI